MYIKKHQFIGTFFLVIMLVSITACDTGNRSDQSASIPTNTFGSQDKVPTPMPSLPPKASPTPVATPAPAADSAPVPVKPGIPPAPVSTGKAILVSLPHQWLYAYEEGKLVFDHAVETGRPELPSPTGSFTIMERSQDVVF